MSYRLSNQDQDKYRVETYTKLTPDEKSVYAQRLDIDEMQPVPFFYLGAKRVSGANRILSCYDAITNIYYIRDRFPLWWTDVKGVFSFVAEQVERLASEGKDVSTMELFRQREMGLIVFATASMDSDKADPLCTKFNKLAFEVIHPFNTACNMTFKNLDTRVQFDYQITDLTWFLREGPAWFLQADSVSCVNEEDAGWLKENMDDLQTWFNIRDEFLPFIDQPKPN